MKPACLFGKYNIMSVSCRVCLHDVICNNSSICFKHLTLKDVALRLLLSGSYSKSEIKQFLASRCNTFDAARVQLGKYLGDVTKYFQILEDGIVIKAWKGSPYEVDWIAALVMALTPKRWQTFNCDPSYKLPDGFSCIVNFNTVTPAEGYKIQYIHLDSSNKIAHELIKNKNVIGFQIPWSQGQLWRINNAE